MLTRGQQVEEDVVLGAHAHEFADLVHLLEEVDVVAFSLTLRFLDQAGQHGDNGGLTSAIVAQKGENLAIEHFDAHATDCAESTREGLLKVVDLEVVASGFESLAHGCRSLVVLVWHLVALECVVVLSVDKGLLVTIGGPLAVALRPAAPIVARRAQEAGAQALAEVRRDDLVEVEAEQGEDDEVEEKHPEGCVERVVVVEDTAGRVVDAHTCALIVGENGRALHQGHLGQQRSRQLGGS
mmetsp:Transcript_6764/g.9284  ORF Transcript_6764/g.9284 Transcript_6764/m.9284 type:complete len:240 (-) Transcript_6764:1184-1903(-)